jgi:hypothetical protein
MLFAHRNQSLSTLQQNRHEFILHHGSLIGMFLNFAKAIIIILFEKKNV